MAADIQRPARRVVKDLPLTRLLPNMLTLMSLCSGLTGMRLSLEGKWEHAVMAIVIAAVFDILDGRVARMLNMASKFGAELDSLSDAISFGVAPAFVLYEWSMKDNADFGWVAVLVFAPPCAWRALTRCWKTPLFLCGPNAISMVCLRQRGRAWPCCR